jgi:hypothetical protein
VKPSYGMDGGVTIYKGRGPTKFTLTIAIWLPEHFGQWALFMKVLEPPSKLKPFVVEMQHPVLSAAGVRDVGVESLGMPERQANGLWLATIQLLEWRKPREALTKPKGAIPAVDKGKPIPPKSVVDRELVANGTALIIARGAARGQTISYAQALETFYAMNPGLR